MFMNIQKIKIKKPNPFWDAILYGYKNQQLITQEEYNEICLLSTDMKQDKALRKLTKGRMLPMTALSVKFDDNNEYKESSIINFSK